jgi:protein subunit release factor B
MSRFPVSSERESALLARMQRLGVEEADIVEKFIRGSGSGGQKVNKTSSAVQLRHIPSGYSVRVEFSRSRGQNRFMARQALCDILEARERDRRMQEKKVVATVRRQQARRSPKTKRAVLEDKRHLGQRKQTRAKVKTDE